MKWLQCSMRLASKAKLALCAAAFWCEIAEIRFCAMHLQSYVDSSILVQQAVQHMLGQAVPNADA